MGSEEDESGTEMLEVSPTVLDAIFPNHEPETICLECGRRFDHEAHEIWVRDDACYFTPNTAETRRARAVRDVTLLFERGMSVEELRETFEATAFEHQKSKATGEQDHDG